MRIPILSPLKPEVYISAVRVFRPGVPSRICSRLERIFCDKDCRVRMGYTRYLVTVSRRPVLPQCSCEHCPTTSLNTAHEQPTD